MSSQSADVIIIGAGLSGLYAGRLLKAGGLKVVILEARDRVGGRTLTVRKGEEIWTDLGGAYITPTSDHRTLKLADDLGINTFPASEKGSAPLKPLYHSGGQSRDCLYTNFLQHVDLQHLHRCIEAMTRDIPSDAPWGALRALEWDHTTVKEFVDRTAWTQVARERGYRLADAIFACGPHEISLLGLLWVLKIRGGMQSLVGAYGPGERRVDGGAQQISEKLSEDLDVRVSSPVIHIDQSDNSKIALKTSSNIIYRSSYVIISIPPPLINRISFTPPLPAAKIQLIQRLPMGSVIKTVTFYKEAFWRTELGRSGILSSDGFPVTTALDDTRPMGVNPCITGFISGDNARKSASLTKDQRRDLVIKQYAETFQSSKFLTPILYLEQNWLGEEYSGGCYVSALLPGVLTTFKDELRRPHDRIHFCGTESARICMGYMEGALESAERAASEILALVNKS